MNHLDFYFKRMESGRLEEDGLCGEAHQGSINRKLLELFEPTSEDQDDLDIDNQSSLYWASGLHPNDTIRKKIEFTPLRQTIVLFMACIAGEKF